MSGLINKRNCARQDNTILGVASITLAALVTVAGTTPLASQREHADIWEAAPAQAIVQPQAERRVLVFSLSKGFQHQSIGPTEVALQYIGEKTGAFEVTVSRDMAVFDAANLARFDAVLFNNTTQLTFDDPEHRRALLEFLRGGKGVIGIHAASDNFYNWPEAAEMMGGLFDGHPWHAGGTWAVKLDEPNHPLNGSFEGNAFLINDEIYQVKGPYSRDTHRVLLSLDMSNMRNHQVEGINRDDGDFAISWIKPFGAGRVFYCSLGHNLEVLANKAVLAHYLAGIQYALGDLDADDAPSNTLAGTPSPALTTDPGAIEDPFAAIVQQDFGSSRLAQAAIEDIIRNTAPGDYGAIEDRLIEILENPASTYSAKQFVCRMLRRVGSERSVPYLSRMLLDEQLTDDARFAMQGMESPEVDRVLRESLDQLAGPALIGVIGTIGQRGDRDAVGDLMGLVDTADIELTEAIVVALGEIGGVEAREALIALELPSALELLRQDALLRCADGMVLAGATDDAREIYQGMTADEFPAAVRVAAWRGLVRMQQADAVPSLLALLKSDEPALQHAGARFMVELKDVADLMPVAEQSASFPASAQVLAVSALGSAGVVGATQIVTDLVERETGAVRAAAIVALGDLGDASHVPLLTTIAVAQGDSMPARASLVHLWGDGVDDQIILAASEYQNDGRAVMVDVLAARYAAVAVPTFVTYAEDGNQAVRQASIAALAGLAEDNRLPELIALLERSETEEDRLALEEAIVVVAERMADRVRGQDRLIEALELGSEPNRISFTRILGNWPDTSPLDPLLRLAASTNSDGERKAAIAGVLNLMRLSNERSSDEDQHLFSQLLELAQSSEEKGLVLDGLAGRDDVWIFGMVEPLLHDPELAEKAEAVRAELVELVARTVSHDGAGRPVTLAMPPAEQYEGGGANALTDDRWGSTNAGDGTWQGFEGKDLDAVIDLGSMTEINSIRAGFLEATGSWIFLPREVTFAIAGDDRIFETVATFTIAVPEEYQRATTRSVSTELSGKTGRYVRVVAKNIGALPEWHGGAGGLAWLFADEIQINAHLEQR
jgi:type 1 glutamine amidotransferase/HEAT repeat protein